MDSSATEFLPWKNHYDSEVAFTLNYPDVSLDELFRQSVEKHEQSVALIYFGQTISYGELGLYVNKLAASLINLNIQKGDKVALLLPNSPQFVMSYYAILSIGATVVPINPLSTETELLHIFYDAHVKSAIALDLIAGKLESVRDKCHNSGKAQILEHTFYTSLDEFMPIPLKLIYPFLRKLPAETKKRLPYCSRFKTLLNQKSMDITSPKKEINYDLALLIYTGGTTGKPKGVMLSHSALVANAIQGASWVQMNNEDRLLAVLPIFHGFGMSVCMNAPLISGASCILIPRFEAFDILKGIHRFHATLFAGVPTMYIGLMNHPRFQKYDLSSLRGCFVGAAPLAPEVKRQFENLSNSRLMEGYGLTEAVTAICANPYQGTNKTGSIGLPFPDVILQIKDIDTGDINLPPMEIGEIAVKGPDLMLGYYNRQEETAAALRKGWLFTGDLGYMDEDGYFYLVDRKKDMIITGGFNVYPREVEDVLYQHPSIKEACVIGLKDAYRGEIIKAFITIKEGSLIQENDILTFCRLHLINYKVPQQVEICTDLPKTAIGKILKRALRDEETAVSAAPPIPIPANSDSKSVPL